LFRNLLSGKFASSLLSVHVRGKRKSVVQSNFLFFSLLLVFFRFYSLLFTSFHFVCTQFLLENKHFAILWKHAKQTLFLLFRFLLICNFFASFRYKRKPGGHPNCAFVNRVRGNGIDCLWKRMYSICICTMLKWSAVFWLLTDPLSTPLKWVFVRLLSELTTILA
jgi:hypothetical protein